MKTTGFNSPTSRATLFAGLLFAAVAAQALTVAYTYDAAGRLTGADYGGGASVSYAYDDNGNPLLRETFAGAVQHALRYAAAEGGTLVGAATQTVARGASGTPVLAATNLYYRFVQWSDGRGDNPRADTNVTADVSATAQFAPLLAAQGTPQGWLARYGLTGDFDAQELSDGDGDTFKAWKEYVADTDPTNALSFLRVTAISNGPPVSVAFEPASASRAYTLQGTTNLAGGAWTDVPGQGPRPGAGGPDQMTDPAAAPARFYRVKVEVP